MITGALRSADTGCDARNTGMGW